MNWYILGSAGLVSQGWGITSDVPAPGDFDGDGKTDFCVFRPSNTTWYILRSTDNGYSGTSFGSSTDVPVPADYDGDGLADIAVFRPSNSTWYVLRTSDGTMQTSA